MIDFHSHILPMMDDGAQSLRESLEMLSLSKRQGVDTVIATPHFYADDEDPRRFLARRARSYGILQEWRENNSSALLPDVRLGAEVLYFEGISGCSELRELTVEGTPLLLVEPDMRWTDYMISEIEEIGIKQKLVPVIAHIDRYMRVLDDYTLIDRLYGRRLFCQINASFLIRMETRDLAARLIADRRVHFIGSDCHNCDERAPNLGYAAESAAHLGISREYRALHSAAEAVLNMNR